jgi:Fe-S cluster biosynthesis and repair protein YggX
MIVVLIESIGLVRFAQAGFVQVAARRGKLDRRLRESQANRRNFSPSLRPVTMGSGSIFRMAHMVFCVRNKKEMEGLDEPPFDSEFGQKIYKNVSKAAWDEWLNRQKMLLNEYRLQPWLPQAQQFLVEQMEEFFFGSGSALPSEFVPPEH